MIFAPRCALLPGKPAAGLALMGSTRELWYRTAQPEGLERSLRFLELCPQPGRERAYALITAGRLATTVMDQQLARRLLEEALQMAAAAGTTDRAAGLFPAGCFAVPVRPARTGAAVVELRAGTVLGRSRPVRDRPFDGHAGRRGVLRR